MLEGELESQSDTEEMKVNDMAKEVYQRVVAQYLKANVKFSPVILDEAAWVKSVVTGHCLEQCEQHCQEAEEYQQTSQADAGDFGSSV